MIRFSQLVKVDFEKCILPHISDMSQVAVTLSVTEIFVVT